MSTKEATDRLLLRELIDRVAILGDRKDFKAQVELFTADAVSETFAGNTPVLKLKGRQEMEEAFAGFLKDYETIYHFNGQQVLHIDGEHATGTCYCLITLTGNEEGKKIRTTIGAVYQDEYVYENGRWLISSRIGNFSWQDKVGYTL